MEAMITLVEGIEKFLEVKLRHKFPQRKTKQKPET